VTRDASAAPLLEEAAAHPVTGWDFAWLGDRISTTLPWSFDEVVARRALRSPDLLDIGTGGGEWLAALPHRPPRTAATESWPPNVDLAGSRLRPLGVTVVRDEGAPDNVEQGALDERGRLPFPARSFALVCSRHSSFVASEVARVLTDGGVFLTEQVGGSYDDFYDALGLPRPAAPSRRWDLRLAEEQLAAAGLRVADSAEGAEVTSFADVGALAWYLRAIPWTVDGFSLGTHRRELERVDERIRTSGPLTVRLPAFWLEAVKAAGAAR
jgi:SAM-dependent methyltransferase